jgi:hypothetical protein
MAKDHTPPETKANYKPPPQTKANQTKRQTQPNSPEEENTRFHQLNLDKSQDKHRPLKQHRKPMHIWPRHKCYKGENNHQQSQAQTICRPQIRKAHWTCSTTRKMWTITATHLTAEVETIQLKVMST